MIKVKVLSDSLDALIRYELIVQKPIKVLSDNFNIIGHDFLESSIIGNNKQIDHDYITHFKTINHLWKGHVTKGIDYYKGCLWVILDECLYLG